MSAVFIALNVAAGTDQINVTFDSALYGCQFMVSEFNNVIGIDTSTSASTPAPQVTAGSLSWEALPSTKSNQALLPLRHL
jgi:hypothetical protein